MSYGEEDYYEEDEEYYEDEDGCEYRELEIGENGRIQRGVVQEEEDFIDDEEDYEKDEEDYEKDEE
jgi:hypothetical protein